jgi:subtilisin family serine protease
MPDTQGGKVRRKLLIAVAVLATAYATAIPAIGADGDPALASAPKPVERSEYDSYIVVMKADPLVATEGKDNLDTNRARQRADELKKSHDKALTEAGVNTGEKVQDYVNALNGFSATLSYSQAVKVGGSAGVALVLPDELQQATTDSSPSFLGLDGPGGPWQTGYDGRGVVVGVIDTGIWPEHASFADDGSFPTPPTGSLPCQFGNTAHNSDDVAFTCNNKLIGARQTLATYRALIGAAPDEFDSARDDNGHGTHTASTAAGNAGVEASIFDIPRGTISGIAPRAHVIAYKGLGNLGGFTSDLAGAIDQAVLDGVDVINYSIGGGASLTGADEIAFLFAADAGVFVATSAGNSGPGDGTIGGPASVPWLTSVGANTQPRFLEGTVVLGDGTEYQGASVTQGVGPAPLVDAADFGNELCDPAVAFTGDITDTIVLCKRGDVGRAAKSLAVFNAGGVGMVQFNAVDVDNLFTDNHWVPSVHIDFTPGLAIKAYIDAAGSSATAEISDTTNVTTWPSAPSMTIFSSRGPNTVAEDIIKPDITAPGLQILAGNSPFPDPNSTPGGELFQAIAGTSMSSPHVAGVFALIKQAHPDWSAAAAKSAIMTTSYQDVVDNDRTTPANPFQMGAGHLDPGSKVHKGSAFQPGLVYEAGLNEYFGFLCDAAPEIFVDPAGTCALLDSIGVPTDASDLNLASIGVAKLAGSQTVTRTVTSVAKENGSRTYEVSVDAPSGYSVTVSPSSFKLKKGQSATYEVTIVNESGPIGEWRFGSLTWHEKTGHYDVYSPIAVKAAQFDAPETVTGSGASGSASFDVFFGYTGEYEASSHGLEPATETSDNVLQDPNQTFSPDDVAAGGANAHTFNLSGVSFFRVAIPPEATEADADLDVFVFDPGGTQVATSTTGGTDEEVNIENPDDGVWTVYVHGWAAPGGDSDYTMYSWAISGTPGGNLTIEGAPTAATIGTTGTIDLSWTGATLGQWHLGAVTHHDGSGPIGMTLIEVDNR